jgi:hypothetical protein
MSVMKRRHGLDREGMHGEPADENDPGEVRLTVEPSVTNRSTNRVAVSIGTTAERT